MVHSRPRRHAEGLRFALSKSEAKEAFAKWATTDSLFAAPPKIESLRAVYMPFWEFEGSVSVRRRGSTQEVLHPLARCNGVTQFYAGHRFRRSMLDCVKNYLNKAVPFQSSFLNDVPDVEVDAWTVYETTALANVRAALLEQLEVGDGQLAFRHLRSHCMYLPAFVVDYRHFGVTFRVFINGVTGTAYGLEHLTLRGLLKRMRETSPVSATVLGYILFRAPLLLAAPVVAAGAVSVYNTIMNVLARDRSFRDWERTKEQEREMQRHLQDSWTYRVAHVFDTDADRRRRTRAPGSARAGPEPDPGTAAAGGGGGEGGGGEDGVWARARTAHDESFWAAWEREREAAEREARAKAEAKRRAEERTRARAEEEAERRLREAEAEAEREAEWQRRRPAGYEDVDGSDLYAVLGLSQGPRATTAEVQAAFRREMMRWHPDHVATHVPRSVANERTRLIVSAYQVLRSGPRRQEYDSGYAPGGGGGRGRRRWRPW